MARGSTVSTGLTSFVGNPDRSGVPQAKGTSTKFAIGYSTTQASGTFTVIGDIQKAGGTPPAGSSYGASLPYTDVIKSAALIPGVGGTPVDITAHIVIAGDNSVTITNPGRTCSACEILILFDEADKMGSKR